MNIYVSTLEYDEESDYILEVIKEYEKQGLTTNVDFGRAEEERLVIAKKLNINLNEEVVAEVKTNETELNKEEIIEEVKKINNETLEENVNLTKDEINVLLEINNKKDVFDLVM